MRAHKYRHGMINYLKTAIGCSNGIGRVTESANIRNDLQEKEIILR